VLFCLFRDIVKIDEIVLCEIVLFDCNNKKKFLRILKKTSNHMR
jgi:hypothetical protein